jgi:hypothetical protein
MEAMEKWGKNRRGWVQRIRGMKNVTILFGYCFELFLDFLLSTFFEWGVGSHPSCGSFAATSG